jgi:hypothetical protein
MLVTRLGDVSHRIESTRVHVARLSADDRRSIDPRQLLAQLVGAHPTL